MCTPVAARAPATRPIVLLLSAKTNVRVVTRQDVKLKKMASNFLQAQWAENAVNLKWEKLCVEVKQQNIAGLHILEECLAEQVRIDGNRVIFEIMLSKIIILPHLVKFLTL